MRKGFKTTVKILCFGIVMISFIACGKGNKHNAPLAYVEIVGAAEKEVEPDIFYLSFNLNEPDKTKKNDINALEQRMLLALKSLNIDTKTDLTVTDISGDSWYWWRKNRPVYQNKSYLLKAGNLNLTNKICDKLDSLKVSYALSKVDYSKMDELKKEVQQEAVKKARLKAENLLSGENRKVGELIYLQEQGTSDNQNPYRQYEDKVYIVSANEANFVQPPSFQKMKVSYQVIARFSIK